MISKMNFSSCLGCIRRYLFRYVTRYINESSTSGLGLVVSVPSTVPSSHLEPTFLLV
jgi:hypothetical protein